MSEKIAIRTDEAPSPAADYSQAMLKGEPFPARTTIFCGLGKGMLVEIDALAVVG